MNTNPGPRLKFSPHESETLGLRIARGQQHFVQLPVSEFRQEILSGNFDLCKIKVAADQPQLFTQLNELGFPWQITSVLYRNVKEITDSDGALELPEGISYEPFDGSQTEILRTFVGETLARPTGTNFEAWPFNQMISPEQEREMSKAYVMGFSHAENQSQLAWLLKDQGEYVGYFMGNFAEAHFEGTLYGVPPQFRGRGYGKLIYAIMKKICHERGAQHFHTDVQIQNAASQQSTLRGGLHAEGTFFHLFLSPFLTLGREAARSQALKPTDSFAPLKAIQEASKNTTLPLKTWQVQGEKGVGIATGIECWSPFSSPSGQLWLGRAFDVEDRTTSLHYLKY